VIGKAFLRFADQAQAMGQGMERVFGEDMTRPGDGFDQRKAEKRAEQIVRNDKKAFSQYDGKDMSNNSRERFFGYGGYKNNTKNDRNFF